MRSKKSFYPIIFVVGLGLVFFGWRQMLAKKAVAQNNPAVATVKTDLIQKSTHCGQVTFSGFATGLQQSDVAAKVSGRVTAVFKKEGDSVKAGEAILTLDAADAAVTLQNTQSSLVATQNSRTLAGNYYNSLIKAAQTAKTAAKNSGDDNAYGQAKKALASAEAAKKMQLSLLDEQITSGNGMVAASATSLTDYTLTAPYAGTLLRLDVKVGDFVSPGLTAFTVADPNHLEIDSSLAASDAKNIIVGQTVELSSGENKGTGKILALASAGDAVSFKTLVRVAIDKGQSFQLGDFIQVSAAPENVTPALTIAKTAIKYRYDDAFTFTVDADNAVHEQKIILGQDCQDRVEILNGLSENAQVVTNGNEQLQNNELVQIYGK